jgi:hypothetical protein
MKENQALLVELQYMKQQDRGRSVRADKEIILENMRLKRELEMVTTERTSVEQAFTLLRDETRREFQSIQKEFQSMAASLKVLMVIMGDCDGRMLIRISTWIRS